LAVLALIAGCRSEPERSEASASDAVVETPANPASAPAPSPTASDPDATKAAALWLDRLVEPRQKGRYAPRDDCGNLPGARAFREKLAAAVRARDAEAIAAMASEDIRLGFAGDDGRKRFLAQLKAPDGKLIDELAKLLPLGCAPSDGGGLTIPWYFAQDYGDIDSFSAMLVTGVDVPLRAKPDGQAAGKPLSWDLVMLDKGWLPEKPFQQVTTLGGDKGFVATDKLRSMIDFRLLAVRQGEAWRINALVAGD
jgi:hypothetical protein